MTYFLLPDIDLWLSHKVAKLDCTTRADSKYWKHKLLKQPHTEREENEQLDLFYRITVM